MPLHENEPFGRADFTNVPAPPRFCPLAWLSNHRRRAAVYSILLVVAATWASFYQLGEGLLHGDEAAFAYTTSRMAATGDWVVPYVGDSPHLNATPLYNWLTLLATPWLDDQPFRYRFWSAVFGVGCVLLTFALGAILFDVDLGLLAGLFLISNRAFLIWHGVRFGGMDAQITFFLTAAVVGYAWLHHKPGRRHWSWVALGVCIGLAWLSKPPVFGMVFFGAIGLHHMVVRRQERLRGPLLALAAALVVAAPWYVLLWFRLGNEALYQLFVFNSVTRALAPEGRDYLWCHTLCWKASITFRLTELALVAALACWMLDRRRPQWGLLLFVTGSFLVSLTVSARFSQYLYYAFPLLCVFLAGLFMESGPWLAVRFWARAGTFRPAVLAGTSLAALLLAVDTVRLLSSLAAPDMEYPPLRIYERLLSELDRGNCRFIMFSNYRSDRRHVGGRTWITFEDLYYGASLSRADWIDTVDELKRLLDDGRPTLVVLPPHLAQVPASPAVGDLRYDEWIELGGLDMRYPVLSFNGGTARLHLGDLRNFGRSDRNASTR